MPPRPAPTARQRRLGAELRKMREQAGMNAAEAGAALGADRTRISNIEAGRFGVSGDRVRALARIYSCPDQAYVDALAAMAKERGKGWWEEYRGALPSGALDLAELEHHATGLRSVLILHMPGLLQTEEYAKAVFATAVPKYTPRELRRRLSHRMKRRDVLDRDTPLPCTFIIHESALRMEYGGPEVARDQIRHVMDASERENITVRVIPFSAGGFPIAGSSISYTKGPVPQLDTVQLDLAHGESLLDAETHLSNHRAIIDQTERVSLTPEESHKFMQILTK